jgi:hypothetical protein
MDKSKENNMAKKTKEPKDIWEYADWLYVSGRLTADEHLTLKKFIFQLEHESSEKGSNSCGNCDGCEQSYGCEYSQDGC